MTTTTTATAATSNCLLCVYVLCNLPHCGVMFFLSVRLFVETKYWIDIEMPAHACLLVDTTWICICYCRMRTNSIIMSVYLSVVREHCTQITLCISTNNSIFIHSAFRTQLPIPLECNKRHSNCLTLCHCRAYYYIQHLRYNWYIIRFDSIFGYVRIRQLHFISSKRSSDFFSL